MDREAWWGHKESDMTERLTLSLPPRLRLIPYLSLCLRRGIKNMHFSDPQPLCCLICHWCKIVIFSCSQQTMTRRANLTHQLFSCCPQRGFYITKWLEKKIQKVEYFVPCTSCRKFSIHKISFMVTQSYSFVYLSSMAVVCFSDRDERLPWWSSVAKILHFQCRGPRFDPWSG